VAKFKPMTTNDMFSRQEITDAEASELDQLEPVFLNTGLRHYPEYTGWTESQIARNLTEQYRGRGQSELVAQKLAKADARALMVQDRPALPKRWWQRIGFVFAWYALWVGFYWDRQARRLYILPVPTLGLVLDFED
jgi:hypothetical protein